jgi:hypothetical protein
VVQEQLTRHQVEGKVVESPAKNAHTDFIIEALEGDIVVIAEATLPSKNSKALDRNVEPNECSGAPPNYGVTDEIYLATRSRAVSTFPRSRRLKVYKEGSGKDGKMKMYPKGTQGSIRLGTKKGDTHLCFPQKLIPRPRIGQEGGRESQA